MIRLVLLILCVLISNLHLAHADSGKRTAWMTQHVNPDRTLSIYDPQVRATLNVTVATPSNLRDYEADQLIKDISGWRIPLKDMSAISDNDTTLDRLKMVLAQEGVFITSRLDQNKGVPEPALWYDGGRAGINPNEAYYSSNSLLHAADMIDRTYYADVTFSPTSMKIKKFPNEQDVSVTVYYRDKDIASEVKSLLLEKHLDAVDGQSNGGAGYYVTFPINKKIKSEKDLFDVIASVGINFEEVSIDDYIALKAALKQTGVGGEGKTTKQEVGGPVDSSVLGRPRTNPLSSGQKNNPLKK